MTLATGGAIRRRLPRVDSMMNRLRPASRDAAADLDTIAAVAERLSVLLTAGVPASAAWGHLGSGTVDQAGDGVVLAAAARAAAHGDPVAVAIASARAAQPAASAAWPVLAAAWSVAEESGAPLAVSLRELAAGLRDEAQLRREVRAALAGPAASARLVTTLPLLAIGFGATLGFDTLVVLFANPLGLACLLVGSALLWAGRRWNAALARRASRRRGDAGLEFELLAVAMSSGASIDRARATVDRAMTAHRLDRHDARGIDAMLALAARAGAPVAELLRSEAFRLRRAGRAAGAERAAALGVRLMVPLGVCVLPSFVLLGVAPIMISVISGTLAGAS
ncbi:type II secretion system F family protein [Agromyces ramosus]|uniref:Tight adherence protein B n=1 Tax=Agromyces ramosus TaxID=33879 RepID=A0ABU0RB38_9MICO|nr:type II secretion system F family protein [Agromyces ramosus]MDQ0895290.1 tight adherence protein B [Agromyces ramosus]